jgi:hypothetical protein
VAKISSSRVILSAAKNRALLEAVRKLVASQRECEFNGILRRPPQRTPQDDSMDKQVPASGLLNLGYNPPTPNTVLTPSGQ